MSTTPEMPFEIVEPFDKSEDNGLNVPCGQQDQARPTEVAGPTQLEGTVPEGAGLEALRACYRRARADQEDFCGD